MKNILNKLFFCYIDKDYYGGFWKCTTDTPKTFKLKRLDDGGGSSYFEQDDIITQRKDNNCKHTWRNYDRDWFVVYPFMEGIPYLFEPLTEEHINREIRNCRKSGVSNVFYKNLLKEL